MPAALPDLPVIRTLGGCGGTLLTRLFAALPRMVVLSETNPRSAHLFAYHLNPLRQLRRWRPELLEHVTDYEEAEIGDPDRFGAMLQGIAAAAAAYGCRLILRDFNYADFIGTPFVWPATDLSSLDAALAGRFTPRAALLVRHPADQLASLRTHRAIAHTLTADRFVAGAAAFLAAYADTPLFRYEALTATPEPVFRAICAALDVPFDACALDHFADVDAVTGSLARAAEDRIAAPEPSAGAALARRQLARVDGYAALCVRLGYPA